MALRHGRRAIFLKRPVAFVPSKSALMLQIEFQSAFSDFTLP
jgi:hypothetical protein